MSAISFKREWITALLTGDKKQTTRRPPPEGKPPRFVVGDLASIYIEQRGRIANKPLYPTTAQGRAMIFQKILDGKYPCLPTFIEEDRVRYTDLGHYCAHFLGIVRITEVATICPAEMSGEDLESWAWADGFCDFDAGDRWFVKHHSDKAWADQTWDVVRWSRWEYRYFDPIFDD